MGSIAAAFVFSLAVLPPLSFAERVDGERAVEKARYGFVVGATKPFDETYPRSVFEERVRRETAQEGVLVREFGMEVTSDLLKQEYDRIERETKAPDQWTVMKSALGNDQRRMEQIVCRPLLVDRALRTRFAFDPKIHEKEHQEAREARNAFLAGKTPSGVKQVRLSSQRQEGVSTDEMLATARGDSAGPKLLTPRESRKPTDGPFFIDPQMAKILEKELKAKGDVTKILEERDRFSVFRLVVVEPSEWLVEAVQIPKRNFDRWLEELVPRSAR